MCQACNELAEQRRALVAMLPAVGSRQLGNGPTQEELILEAGLSAELEPLLDELYRDPLSADLEEVIDEAREVIIAWLANQYRQNTATQASIEQVLNKWRLQAANVGGQLGLEALGLDGTFSLTDEEVIAILEARTAMLTDIDGDISIVRTTAIELGRRIFAQRLEGLALGDILAGLPVYISSRSLQRSGNIAQSETVDASRTLLQEVYHRNGAETMIFRTQPELREDPVCPICDPYNGTEHPTTGRPGVSIPVHTMCNCYWDPVLPPEQPEEVWRG